MWNLTKIANEQVQQNKNRLRNRAQRGITGGGENEKGKAEYSQ